MRQPGFPSVHSRGMPALRWVRHLPVMLFLVMLPEFAHAQVVEGHLFVKNTREPIVLAVVALLDTTMTPMARTITTETGEFALIAPQPGSYYIAADRSGYKRGVDGILDLQAGGHIRIEFYLAPDPEEAPRTVQSVPPADRSEAGHRYLEEVGFFRRLDEGAAWFFTPEDIERELAPDVVSIFRRAPLIRIVEGPPRTLLFRGGVPNPNAFGSRVEDPLGYCTPRVVVDGVDMPVRVSGMSGAAIESAVDVQHLLAVELHNGPTSLPPQYTGTATGGNCATILLWTIRG